MTVERLPANLESPLTTFNYCYESVRSKSQTVLRYTEEYRQEVLELRKAFEKWYATL